MSLTTTQVEEILSKRIDALDTTALCSDFSAADEFIHIENFLPANLLEKLLGALSDLEPAVHRNFIPGHKKGGSVSRYDLDRLSPVIRLIYESPAFVGLVNTLCGQDLSFCPPTDPHTYALYYYTEPGDHIGYHYDTSYYHGARYTVLLGVVDDSSCELEYQLYTKSPDRETQTSRVHLRPGALVLFNGDKLRHRITPLGDNERRISLTFEYLTNTQMHPFLRFVSNMKDSIAYFGFKQVFKRD